MSYINKVIKKLEQEGRGALSTWQSKSDVIKFYGLQPDEISHLTELEKKSLDKLIGHRFDVADYIEVVGCGGYDFVFMVLNVSKGTVETNSTTGFMKVSWLVDAVVLLEGATVELMVSEPELPSSSLIDALSDPDIGWEISSEVADIIYGVITWEEPILKALNTEIDVEQSYSDTL